MIAIIDYNAGNLKSVEKALHFLGQECVVTRDFHEIEQADKVILPGVGAFGDAMGQLKKYELDKVIREVTEKADRIKEARNICIYAYNRNLGGRSLVFKMTELSIRLEDYEEAEDLYNEFVEMAPTDMNRYVLLYELDKAKNVPPEELIKVLEEYRDNEQDENFGYELASLYAEVGRTTSSTWSSSTTS